ncbi:hypothetical protein CPB86DRAFT_307254 [Serendipita vermifera]|nr:hypothetical protein CPB86DRAFT_307254 [Serendipita vermifera]
MSSGDYLTDSYAGRYGYGGAGMYSTKESNGGVGGTATWGTRHDEYGGVDKACMGAGGGKWEGRTDMRPKASIMLSSLKRKVSVLNPAVALAHLSNRSTDRGTPRDMNGVSSGNGVGSGGAVGRSNSFGNIKTSLSGLFSKTGRHSGQPSPDSYESRGGSVNKHGEDVKAPVPVPHLYNSYKSRPSTDAGVGTRPLLTTGPAVPFQIPVLDNGGALDPTTITRPDPALLASTATTQPLSSKFPATESIRIPLTTKPNLRDLPSPPVVPPANQTSFPADSGAPTGTDSNRVSTASPTMDFTSPTTGNVVYSHPFSTAGVYQPIKSSSASMRSRQGSDAIVDISDIGSATHGNSYGQGGGASGSGYHPYAPYAADYGKRGGTGYGPFGGSTSSLQLPDSASVDNQTYSSHAPLREGSEKGKGKAVYEPGRNVVELSGKGASGQETSSVRSGGTRELPPIPPNAAQTNGHVRSNSDASLVAKPATTTTGAAARNEWGTFHKFPSTSSLTQPQTQPQLQSTTVSRNPEHFTHSRSNSFSSYDRINLGMHNRNNSTPSISYYPNATSADGLARSYDQTVFTRPESRASSVSSKRFSNQLFSR